MSVFAQNLGNVDTIATRNQQTRLIPNKTFDEVDNALLDTLFDLDWSITSGYNDYSGLTNKRSAYKSFSKACATLFATFEMFKLSATILKRSDGTQLRLDISTGNCKLNPNELDLLYKPFWSTIFEGATELILGFTAKFK